MSAPLPVPLVTADGSAPPVRQRRRAPAVLINLILWPGIGHLLVGRFLAGSLWAAASLALWLAAPVLVVLPLIGFANRILSAVEVGFRPAPASEDSPTWLWFLAGLGAVGIVFVTSRVFYLQAFKIPQNGMAPTLVIGDHLFANKLAYRLGDVERGDVVVFVNPCQPDTDFVKRVVGLPGDTVEVRCDVLHVNGRAVLGRLVDPECTYVDRDMRGVASEASCSRYGEKLGDAEYEVFHERSRPGRDQERAQDPSLPYARVAGAHDFPDAEPPSCMREEGDEPEVPRPPGRIVESAPPASGGSCAPRRHYVVPDGEVFVMGDNRDNSSDSRAWGPVPIDLIKGRAFGIWWSSNPRPEGIAWGRIGRLR